MSKPQGKGPAVSRDDAVTLLGFLRGKGYQKRKDIPADLFGNNDTDRRKVRAICQAYPKHFMSTQSGYILTAEAPHDDLEKSIADLRSRSMSMLSRATELEGVLLNRLYPSQQMLL